MERTSSRIQSISLKERSATGLSVKAKSMLRRFAKKLPANWRNFLGKFYVLNFNNRDLYDKRLTPEHLRRMLAVGNIINRDQGYRRSLIEERCLNAQGEPIPWYTYPAIEYLSSLDLSESDIFEYGAGASTLWWAKRARSVTSVEALADWYERIAREMPDNCRLIHEPDLERFPDAIEQCDQTFDVIAVDGPGHAMIRLLCVYFAIKKLGKGGMIVLDNADVLPMSVKLLIDSGFIPIPFSGLTPLNTVSGTTAVFLTRDFAIQTKPGQHLAIGGMTNNWEEEAYLTERARQLLAQSKHERLGHER